MKIGLYMSLELWSRSGKSNSDSYQLSSLITWDDFVEKFMKYWWTYRS